ncbi:MAG: sugar phosphate isomerase/epimerase [Bacteroidetes bacterium]|nr:MAG: sugar phosphate isomerase/epimerase [Bacteroidota bacterium]
MQSRRSFFRNAALTTAALTASPGVFSREGNGIWPEPSRDQEGLFFGISLAEWSLNQSLFGGKLDNLDFPAYAKNNFDIHAVEYVNQFFPSASQDYARQLLGRTEDIGVKNLLIMVDREGNLGETDEAMRKTSVENHYKWVECAKTLGCHSIRVNAGGRGTREEVAAAAVASLSELSLYASDFHINVIVENHGGYSSDGSWLSGVIRQVGMINCGTLPDFGNFRISREEIYDTYQGIKELMPFAKGVSAKSHEFDEGYSQNRPHL